MAPNRSSIWEIFRNSLSSSVTPLTVEREFCFRGKKLFYNSIPYNHLSERCVEIPIAFDFLAHLQDKSQILEIGNTLSYYENSLSDVVGVRHRRIVDKFENNLGIDSVDVMDLSSKEKYSAIVSISTVEHIGQGLTPDGEYGEQSEERDLEAPLKAIAKIYDLLRVGGRALITVPFGKFIDAGWFIQFSSEYLRLLETKFGVPKEALSVSFLKRLAMEQSEDNPYQLWGEALAEELVEVTYGACGPCAGALALIELTKLPGPFVLDLNVAPTPLVYQTGA